MTIKARVHNHTIVLPPDLEIPEGAEVQVVVPTKAPPTNGSVSAFIGEWAGAFTVPNSDVAGDDARLAYLLGKHVK
jgi:hypothetical protein